MLAYNEETGETGEYLVTATIAHHDPTVVYLTISGETLTTTAEHPFYTTDGEWIDAGELPLGTEIVALDGTFGTVEAVTVAADAQPMYNLTVDTAHTFFVGDGQWLVHNTNTNCLRAIRDEASTLKKHTRNGSEVLREQRKGNGVHIFNDDVNLGELENLVWTQGTYTGEFRNHMRFYYESPNPIGVRMQNGKEDLPLYGVEIKVNTTTWKYHMDPRTRPASPNE